MKAVEEEGIEDVRKHPTPDAYRLKNLKKKMKAKTLDSEIRQESNKTK